MHTCHYDSMLFNILWGLEPQRAGRFTVGRQMDYKQGNNKMQWWTQRPVGPFCPSILLSGFQINNTFSCATFRLTVHLFLDQLFVVTYIPCSLNLWIHPDSTWLQCLLLQPCSQTCQRELNLGSLGCHISARRAHKSYPRCYNTCMHIFTVHIISGFLRHKFCQLLAEKTPALAQSQT